jgi:hypothetical protein
MTGKLDKYSSSRQVVKSSIPSWVLSVIAYKRLTLQTRCFTLCSRSLRLPTPCTICQHLTIRKTASVEADGQVRLAHSPMHRLTISGKDAISQTDDTIPLTGGTDSMESLFWRSSWQSHPYHVPTHPQIRAKESQIGTLLGRDSRTTVHFGSLSAMC